MREDNRYFLIDYPFNEGIYKYIVQKDEDIKKLSTGKAIIKLKMGDKVNHKVLKNVTELTKIEARDLVDKDNALEELR